MRRIARGVILVFMGIGADAPPRVPAGVPVDEAKRDAVARYAVGRLHASRGRLPDAARQLEASAKADPASVAAQRDLVQVYIDLGREPSAVRVARMVLAAHPTDADTAHTLARLLYEAKRPGEAADAIAGAIDGPPLAKRPTKKLAMLRDLARFRGDEASWRAVVRFLADARTALLREGFTPVELDRETVDANEKLGAALVAAKRFDAAAVAFADARKLAADRTRANDPFAVARTHWHTANLLAAEGDAAAAVGEVEKFLTFEPTGPGPYARYAELLRASGRGTQAVEQLRAVVAAHPKAIAANWVLAAEQLRSLRTAPVGHVAFRELVRSSVDPALFRVLAKGYADAGRADLLLELADELFPPPADGPPPKNPPDVPAEEADRRQAFAAAVAAEWGQQAGRLAASARGAHSADVWEIVAGVAEAAGRTDDLEAALRAGLRASEARQYFRGFQRLRAFLYRHRKWEDLLALCDAAAGRGQMAPGYVSYFRAGPLAELGRADEAVRAAEAAQADTRYEGLREHARVLGVLGRYEAQRALCAKLLDEFPRAEEVRSTRFLLADAYLGLKRFADTEAELRGILDEDPDDVLALNNLGYNLADQNRNLDEAERLIRRALELDADEKARAGAARRANAAYLDSLGWVLFRRGRLADARSQLEAAAALPDGATDPTVWDHLGDVCFRLGDKPAAGAAWRTAAATYVRNHQGRQLGRRDEVIRKLKLVE